MEPELAPHSAPQAENAMTEIALALAMGFFSLMVLTLLSMGAGTGTGTAAPAPQVLALSPAIASAATARTENGATDVIVIYDGSRFLDTDLAPIDPQAAVDRAKATGSRIVLALDPGLSVQQAMDARLRVNAPDLVVSSLDERWLKALAAAAGDRNE